MNKHNILVAGRNEEILQTIIRLINKNTEWEAFGSTDDERLIELFHQHHFGLVLLGSGISSTEESKLRKIFTLQNPDIKIIQHFGGGGGLLENEIKAAFDNNTEGNFSITDNPFQ